MAKSRGETLITCKVLVPDLPPGRYAAIVYSKDRHPRMFDFVGGVTAEISCCIPTQDGELIRTELVVLSPLPESKA